MTPAPRTCARCARPSRPLYESPAGDLRCNPCLKYAGLAAEPDPRDVAQDTPLWIDLRAVRVLPDERTPS